MSFICDICHKPTEPRIPMKRAVIETRNRIYTQKDGRQTYGIETVREIATCLECCVWKPANEEQADARFIRHLLIRTK